MSEYIATAFVRIHPESEGFERALRGQILAPLERVSKSARVNVLPTTTGFESELRRQVRGKIASSGKHVVPVTPELTSFKKDFSSQLREQPILIPVRPDMDPFLAELRTRVAAANKGLQVTIPVVTATGGEIGGGGERAARGASSLNKILTDRAKIQVALNDAAARSLTIETKGNKEITTGLPLEERLNAAKRARTGLDKLELELREQIEVARTKGQKEAVRELEKRKEHIRSDLAWLDVAQQRLDAEKALAEAAQAAARVTVRPPAPSAAREAPSVSARSQSALRSIVDQRAVAQLHLNDAMREGIDAETRLRSAGDALKILETQLTKVREKLHIATRRNQTAETELFSVQKRKLEGAIRFINTEKESLSTLQSTATQTKKLLSDTKASTQADIDASSARASLVTADKALIKSRDTFSESLKEDLTLKRRVQIINDAIAKSEVALRETTNAASSAIRSRVQGLKTVTAVGKFQATQQLTQLKTTRDTLVATEAATAIRAAETGVIQVNVKALQDAAAVKAFENKIRQSSSQLLAVEKAAREAGNTALAAELALLRQSVITREADAASRRAAIRDQAAQVSQQKLLARGAAATGLSFLGIRGATLAASAAFLAGAAAVASFAKAIGAASGLEREINVFGETTGATTDQMRVAAEEARRLGADITLPAVNAADAAESFAGLARAGLDVQNSISGARGVLQLATAANIENAEAVELVASGLNAFGLAGIEASRVADLLTGAANEAQGSISDMGIALQQSSAVARLAGISLEDTVAFLTLLARNGLRGSDAGTSLRTALTRLIRPTDQAATEIQRLGIAIRDTSGNIRADVFDQFAQALSSMEAAQRDSTLAMIFGQDALRAAAILGREGAAGLEEMRVATQQQGLAAALAGARTKGFAGQVEAVRNVIETLGTRIGAAVTGPLSGFIQSLERAVTALDESETAAQGFGGVLDGLVGAIRGLGQAFSVFGGAAVTALSPLIGLTAAVARGFGNLGSQMQGAVIGGLVAFKTFGVLGRQLDTTRAQFGLLLAGQAVEGRAVFARLAIAVGSATTVMNTFVAALAAGVPATTALAGATRGLASAFGLLARSGLGITLVVSAIAAGLIYLITRESAAERATRKLSEATRDLTEALEAADAAARNLGRARLDLRGAEVGVTQARIAERGARLALSGSQAPRGSPERQQLQVNLRAAILDRVQAEVRLNEALRQNSEAEADASQRRRQKRSELANEARAIRDTVRELRAKAKFEVERGQVGDRRGVNTILLEARSQALVTEELKKQIKEQLELGTAAGRTHATRLDLIRRFIVLMGRLPEEHEVNIILQSGNAEAAASRLADRLGLDKQGKEAVEKFIDAFLIGIEGLIPKTEEFFRGPYADAVSREADALANLASRKLQEGFSLGPPPPLQLPPPPPVVPTSIDTQIALAEAQGASDAVILGLLRQQQAAQARFLARIRSLPQTKAREQTIQKAANNLAATNARIESIVEGMNSEAERHRNTIAEARNEADQKIIDSISAREEELSIRAQAAELTPRLRDDLQAAKKIRNFWQNVVQNKIDLIKDMKTRAQALRNARASLLSARQAEREAEQAIRDAVLEQMNRVRETLELNIEFFNITENMNAEIRARQRLIRHLRRMQDNVKEGSNEWLRLRNEIAREQAAIADLKGQAEQRNDEFRKFAFEFLQRQQGFAANLLGNLIPLGATGLVGNISTGSGGGDGGGRVSFPGAAGFGGGLGGALIDERLRGASALAQAQGAGPTRGQATVEIDVLRQILQVLIDIQRGRSHPESREQRARSQAIMDVLHG